MKSAHIALEQVQSIQEHGINRAELDTAQSYLVGHLALEFETSDNVAGKVLDLIEDGLPLDYWNHYPEKVASAHHRSGRCRRQTVFGYRPRRGGAGGECLRLQERLEEIRPRALYPTEKHRLRLT